MNCLPMFALALISAGESADPLKFVVNLQDQNVDLDENGVKHYGTRFEAGAWSNDGRHLALGTHSPRNQSLSWDGLGSVQIFDSSDWTSPPKILLDSYGQMEDVGWSPDDKYLAAGSADGYIRIYDTTTWQIVQKLGQVGWIRAVKWSSTGKLAVYSKPDGGFHKCCYPVIRSSKECEETGGHFHWCPDTMTKDLYIYDKPLEATPPSRILHFAPGYDFALCWSADGNMLAVTGDTRDASKQWDEPGYYTPETALKVFDGSTWQLIKNIDIGPDATEVISCGWSPDGVKLIVAAELGSHIPNHDGSLQIYSSANWARIQETHMEEDADYALAVSKDGLKVAIGDDDDVLNYFTFQPSGNNFTFASKVQEPDEVVALDWTVIDGYDMLAVVHDDKTVNIYKSPIITAPTTPFEPCAEQGRFDIMMCKSYACTMCSLQWCTEKCQRLQTQFSDCRCKQWPDSRLSYSGGDFTGKGVYGDAGDYARK